MYQFTITNQEFKKLNSNTKKLNLLVKEQEQRNNKILSNVKLGVINLNDNVEFDYVCDELITLCKMIISNINNLLPMNPPNIEDLNVMLKDILENKDDFFIIKSQCRRINFLNNVEDIINIYHKFYDNGFNAQLKPNDYKPIFSKTIDNNLFEVVLVIPELLISKDEYNCISVSVFINGELDSPIFDLTQLDEVFSFINNYNV